MMFLDLENNRRTDEIRWTVSTQASPRATFDIHWYSNLLYLYHKAGIRVWSLMIDGLEDKLPEV